MNKTLYNAAKKYLIELCRSENVYALIDYQLHITELYSESLAMILMEEVSQTLFHKYPNSYQWLNAVAVEEMEKEEGIPQAPLLTIDDLAGFLRGDELMLTEGKEFRVDPKTRDKLLMSANTFKRLKEALIATYSTEQYTVQVDIDELVEITESV